VNREWKIAFELFRQEQFSQQKEESKMPLHYRLALWKIKFHICDVAISGLRTIIPEIKDTIKPLYQIKTIENHVFSLTKEKVLSLEFLKKEGKIVGLKSDPKTSVLPYALEFFLHNNTNDLRFLFFRYLFDGRIENSRPLTSFSGQFLGKKPNHLPSTIVQFLLYFGDENGAVEFVPSVVEDFQLTNISFFGENKEIASVNSSDLSAMRKNLNCTNAICVWCAICYPCKSKNCGENCERCGNSLYCIESFNHLVMTEGATSGNFKK